MHIRRAHMNDVSDIATLVADAMADDVAVGVRGFLCPYGYLYPEARRHAILRRCKKRFYQGMDILVAVSDPGDSDWDGQEHIMGYIAMSDSQPDCQPSMMMRLNQTLHGIEESYRWYLHQDPTITHERLQAFFKTQADVDVEEVAGLADQRHQYCEHLSVAPAYQRRGIGLALLVYVQDRAAARGLPILLGSSPIGKRLYLKAGFRQVGEAPFAEGSGIIEPLLRWDPKLPSSTPPES